jgi:hypothetical protein
VLNHYVKSGRLYLGLVDELVWSGMQNDISSLNKTADVMLIISREDSFTSTLQEAMSEMFQVVAFEQSTGAVGLFTKNISYIVLYMNIKAMARKFLELCGASFNP